MVTGINNSLSSIFAHRQITINQSQLNTAMQRLSSALRINSAADDAAGLGISEGFRSMISGYRQAARNVQDGISLVQTAEGGLNEVNSLLQRGRELAIQAANDTLTDEDRAIINEEIVQIREEVNRMTETVEFNERPLLDGSLEGDPITVQAGACQGDTMEISVSATDAGTLGIDETNVLTRDAASDAIGEFDSAITAVNQDRARLGAVSNRMSGAYDFLNIQNETTTAAESRIRDQDMARGVVDLVRSQLLTQSSLAMLAQGNMAQANVLSLLNP